MSRRYLWWGILGGPALVGLGVLATLIAVALAYDGTCGGWLPFLAAPGRCSFREYFAGAAVLAIGVLWDGYWPVLLAVLIVPPFVGLLLRARR